MSGLRADEDEARFGTGPGEAGIFRKKAVAGVDGVHAVLPRQADDAVDVEVGLDRLAGLAEAVGLVGLEAVQGVAILVRVDGDRADAEFVGRAEHANGDLAAIGDEELADGPAASGPAWSTVLAQVDPGEAGATGISGQDRGVS